MQALRYANRSKNLANVLKLTFFLFPIFHYDSYSSFAGSGTARLNFGFSQYSTKADILSAIRTLPKISGSGNDIAGAILLLQNSLFLNCPLRNNSQCVAMILYDNNADNATAVNLAAQVCPCLAN
jgi:hypothetical protein